MPRIPLASSQPLLPATVRALLICRASLRRPADTYVPHSVSVLLRTLRASFLSTLRTARMASQACRGVWRGVAATRPSAVAQGSNARPTPFLRQAGADRRTHSPEPLRCTEEQAIAHVNAAVKARGTTRIRSFTRCSTPVVPTARTCIPVGSTRSRSRAPARWTEASHANSRSARANHAPPSRMVPRRIRA